MISIHIRLHTTIFACNIIIYHWLLALKDRIIENNRIDDIKDPHVLNHRFFFGLHEIK